MGRYNIEEFKGVSNECVLFDAIKLYSKVRNHNDTFVAQDSMYIYTNHKIENLFFHMQCQLTASGMYKI